MGLLVLVRHGETDWNKAQRVMGTSRIGLNETGKAQILWVASMLKGVDIAKIYHSPYPRTKETAHILAQTFQVEAVPSESLCEVGYGIWEGRLFSDLRKDTNYFRYLKDPFYDPGDGIEPILHVQERTVSFLEKAMAQEKPKANLVIVSHGDVIRTALSHYLNLPLKEFRRIRIDNGSVSGVELKGGFAEIKGINLIPNLQAFWMSSYIHFNVDIQGEDR
jgi:broad specificity phosphatase PhoE